MNDKKLKIKWSSVFEILTRTRDTIWNFETPYIDKGNGSVLGIHINDKIAEFDCVFPAKNSFHHGLLESNPNRYLELPVFSKQICQLWKIIFIQSDWTNDKKLKKVVSDCARNDTIVEWFKNIRTSDKITIDPEIIVDSWYEFVEDKFKGAIEKILKENNIDFEWSE